MDCKAFAKRHASFIDDTLPGVELAAMREHLSECAHCSGRDSGVRRALLVLKNLPPIEVSEGFQDRLRARITVEDASAPPARARAHGGSVKWAAAAALLIAIVGVRTWPETASRTPSRLPPVFASLPTTVDDGAEESMPAYMASMSTGIPMWPALMLAEEGPLRFAASEVSRHHD